MSDNQLTIGGFNISGMMVGVALPVLSALGGGTYYAYDVISRFTDVEAQMEAVLAVESRVQAVEQTVATNGVEQLGPTLSSISTQMSTILEQQATLLNLRSQVERSTTITDGLGDDLDTLQQEIDDLWKAYDAFYTEVKENPIR